ncbi:amidohydrolase family protein [Marvinbryantia formatexigens DSM 14469]|uniref:Amidohydrolase family protein n=1 Tax=Marvinbryantia formatexigens DSM 14469 TaxID=478749 RepID=C6LED7_9FIRM|nr:amidohydrolase family protein [Marvinbryantia formatexigens]EET60920.1 amidohydrolase family protein [Marvinbryantia formatexigens DSM 14469]UWO24782.1 amidohydrolase family protein [Marvinbryantia formatexigens DSM 14469]SDF23170.1 Amidohydrolase family protein [Marvinbryantia formatexigens]
MFGECHAHLFMNGSNYRQAVNDHKNGVNTARVREHLEAYRACGITYIRDGGDHFGVSLQARALAGEYGITYRTPVFAIHRAGHYGEIVGKSAQTLDDVRLLVQEVRREQGDFVKIMVSGLVDYSGFGLLSEPALEKGWIAEMIHIAHEEGFAVMVHANGADAVLAAVDAGADSIEHGNYIDRECMAAMAERGCVWVPTIVTTRNLIGCGRYDDRILEQIYDMECENLVCSWELGVPLAVGSDAGAYMVPHGQGAVCEYETFCEVLKDVRREDLDGHLQESEAQIRRVFAQPQ